MSGVKVRALLTGVAAVAMAGALGGCGGQLVGHTGAGGQGGSTDPAGRGGTTGVAGTIGRGGAGGTAGSGGGAFGQPACLSTVTKGGACTAVDQQLCYK